MLINNTPLFLATDAAISEIIGQIETTNAVVPVHEAADAVMEKLACDSAHRSDIVHRICIRAISRRMPLEFFKA